MHWRRLACFILGAWLAGSLFMMAVAIQNFRSVGELMRAPADPGAATLRKLGSEAARALLRYHSGELNRWYFENWERVQIGLGLALVFVLRRAAARPFSLLLPALLMLAVALGMRWFITPEIVRLGRLLDFASSYVPSPERSRFQDYHLAYTVMEVIKVTLGAITAVRLLVRSDRPASLEPRTRQPAAGASAGSP